MKKLIWIFATVLLFSCGGEEKKEEKAESKKIEKPTKGNEQIIPSDVVLGNYAYIEIGVKNTPNESLDFYKKLGFSVVPNQFDDENLTMLSDSNQVIVLNKASIAPAMLIYINEDLAKLQVDLKKEGILAQPIDGGIEIKSPDGIKVTVLEGKSDQLFKADVSKMLGMLQSNDIVDPTKMPNEKIGVFGEFSHQVTDIHASLKWWAKVGLLGSGIMEYGYKYSIIMDKNQISVIGLHENQNDSWTGSAITYFAADQDARLENLKKEIDPSTIHESQNLGPGSAIITAPDGNLIFAYKL